MATDPILRLLVSSSLGLGIALNFIDGTSVLTLDKVGSKDISLPLFFAINILFLLIDLAVLLHILVFEKNQTRNLAVAAQLLALVLVAIPFIADFSFPYKIVSLLLLFFQLPVPFLVER